MVMRTRSNCPIINEDEAKLSHNENEAKLSHSNENEAKLSHNENYAKLSLKENEAKLLHNENDAKFSLKENEPKLSLKENKAKLLYNENEAKLSLKDNETHSRPQSPSCPLAGGAWAHDTRGSEDTRNSNFFHWLAVNNKILNGSKHFRCEASAKKWKVSLPTDCRPQEKHIRAPNFAVVWAVV